MTSLTRQLRDCTSGAAILEAAVVTPVLLILMIGVIEFGRAVQDYHTADKSLRNAVRYLASVPDTAVCGWGWENAKDMAIYGRIDPPDGAAPLLPEWTEDTLTLVRDPACGQPEAEPMTIRIIANVPIPTPILPAIGLADSVTAGVTHQERHIGG